MNRYTIARLAWIPLGAVLGFTLMWLLLACLAVSGAAAVGVCELLERRETTT